MGDRASGRQLRVTGAAGTGKSSIRRALAGRIRGAVFLDTDTLAHEARSTATPVKDYHAFQRVLGRLAIEINESGLTVVYCGMARPEQAEDADVEWLALVADPATRWSRVEARTQRSVPPERRSEHDLLDSDLRAIAEDNPRVSTLDTGALALPSVIETARQWLQMRLLSDPVDPAAPAG